jgi:two-component system NarL family sensor kinase
MGKTAIFVFDYDGAWWPPRRTHLIGGNWTRIARSGTPITIELVRIARTGGGFHSLTGQSHPAGATELIVYVNGLQDWRWVVENLR